jgi:hypothetical protein
LAVGICTIDRSPHKSFQIHRPRGTSAQDKNPGTGEHHSRESYASRRQHYKKFISAALGGTDASSRLLLDGCGAYLQCVQTLVPFHPNINA